MDPSAAGAQRRRAEQCLSVAEKLLVARDVEGCKQFASQALAADPRTPGADDLHAAAAALLAAQRRRLPNGQPDPYAVLGLDPANPASRHPDAIHSHYRRLSFLLNRSRPDRPCALAFADAARLVADAWAFFSDPVLKSALDAQLDAAAAARAHHSPAPNRPQPQPQSPLLARPTPPSAATPYPWPTAPPAAPTLRPTPPPAVPSPRPTPPLASPVAAPPRPTPRPVAPQTWPTPPPAAPPPRPTPRPAALSPRLTPPPPAVAPQTRPTLPSPVAPQTPAAATVTPAVSGAAPSSTFWTVCTACCHIHQYNRHYETRNLLCPSCRQPFVAKAMAEPPPIVPGTDMYYCTWGFFPVGFPGCPGFERMVNSQPRGPDQLNAPWLGGTGGAKGNTGDDAENGVPPSVAVEVTVEAPAVTPPAKPMRVKVGAKKRGRPKGSKNKKKL